MDELTPQQERIAHLIGEGLSNAEIAERLRISENTVRFHLKDIYSRLDVHTRTRLARLVILSAADDTAARRTGDAAF